MFTQNVCIQRLQSWRMILTKQYVAKNKVLMLLTFSFEFAMLHNSCELSNELNVIQTRKINMEGRRIFYFVIKYNSKGQLYIICIIFDKVSLRHRVINWCTTHYNLHPSLFNLSNLVTYNINNIYYSRWSIWITSTALNCVFILS